MTGKSFQSASVPFTKTFGGTLTNGILQPKSISARCGFCGDLAIFSLSWGPVQSKLACLSWGTCPSCSKIMTFMFCYDETIEDGKRAITDVVAYPASTMGYNSLELPEDFPDRLTTAIKDTESAFKAKLYSPTLTCGRRALEGIFKHLDGNQKSKKNLYQLIEDTLSKQQSTKPLQDLAHAIRNGGNLGAHFDLETEPDEETAELVMALLDYIISYFFLMPSKIAEMETKVGKKT